MTDGIERVCSEQPKRRRSSRVSDTTGQIVVPDGADGQAYSTWRVYLAYAGPGLLMSIAYLDIGNLEACLQQGAYTGLSMLWLMLAALLVGFVVQRLAARLGNVTGKHLSQLCAEEYPVSSCCLMYCMCEIAIIAADVQQVLGSALACNILFGFPLWVGCILSFLGALSLLGTEYFGVRFLEGIVASMVGLLSICFFIFAFHDPPERQAFMGGFVPYVPPKGGLVAIGALGASTMPHNIYLHSALVLSRSLNRSDRSRIEEANWYCTLDAAFSLFFALAINVAVIVAFAQAMYSPVCGALPDLAACIKPTPGQDAGTVCKADASLGEGQCGAIGLKEAGSNLAGVFGGYTSLLWGIGLLASGQSSAMMGTYAGQFLMDGFLGMDVTSWARGLGARLVAIVPAVMVASLEASGDGRFDIISEWLNVVQMLSLPFALIPLLKLTGSTRIMGPHASDQVANSAGWMLLGVLTFANGFVVSLELGLDFAELFNVSEAAVSASALSAPAAVIPLFLAYFGALGWLMLARRGPEKSISQNSSEAGIACRAGAYGSTDDAGADAGERGSASETPRVSVAAGV
eukprot:TRINITY_DN6312_c0_g1_i1.p1 TRINITY_DN6312_c0_g1~~TRINITY_DN6312_c0_g1_i1.p1  ORF type:complete len:598 (-),score=115.19 TRINITY_DN6312_c0_g1_i1:79-1803(-)